MSAHDDHSVPLPESDTLTYLSGAEVRAACAEIDPLACMHETLVAHAEGRTVLPPETHLGWTPPGGGEARGITMAGLVDGEVTVAGTKIINANPANVAHGLPRASGLTVLFEPRTARPLCVMEGAHISALRTAAVSVLAARHLVRPGARTAALFGAGVIAREHALMLARGLPGIEEIRVYDSVPGRVAQFERDTGAALGAYEVKVTAAVDAHTAAHGADVLIACTSTRRGYVERSWLAPGALVVNVSLDDLTESALTGADRLYVDDWDLIREDPYRLLGKLLREGRVRQDEAATLGDVLTGARPGRTGDDEVIVVNPFGLAVEDIALAHRVFRVARHRGLGTALPR
ncbi:ornithine cyclodeaminase family protein [Streptomyces sp. NPDC087300]|uniref:ornithine cyclodeaminase family protein n=1 Tax=Streptomyces sp. NPDC087300 TaxID=3365780 RepID=UPI00382C7D11